MLSLGEAWPFTDLLGDLIRSLEMAFMEEHPDGEDPDDEWSGSGGSPGETEVCGRGTTYPGKSPLVRTPSATNIIPSTRRRSLSERRKKRLSAPAMKGDTLGTLFYFIF